MATAVERELKARERMKSVGHPWMLARTVGIYALVPGGRPVPHGSGVLLRIADASFVVSAAHVLLGGDSAEILLAPSIAESRLLVSLGQLKVHATRDTENYDVGYVHLPDTTVRELGSTVEYVRLSDITFEEPPPMGIYGVIGYPQHQVHFNALENKVQARPLFYGGPLFGAATDALVPGLSIAIRVEMNETSTGDGDRARFPELRGISGCGIWRLGVPGRDPPPDERWEASQIRLAGIEHAVIETSVHTTRAIKGTLIKQTIQLIVGGHPELRRAIAVSWSGVDR